MAAGWLTMLGALALAGAQAAPDAAAPPRASSMMAAAIAVQPAQAAGQQLFAATGYVDQAGEERGGWFQFAYSHQRFLLPATERETYLRLLAAAAERGVALRVRYDASAGRADPSGYVEYPLCALAVVTGASFGDEHANCPASAAAPTDSAAAALALGLALGPIRPDEARRELSRALADPQLAGPLRATALEARVDAAETMGAALPWPGDPHDRLAAEALADARTWVGLAPDEAQARYATARLLADLGGYAEAEAVYRAIGRRWPEESFEVAVRIGALYRRQGRYAEALRQLDPFVGIQDGMKLHYHRGWTLVLLGRPREALVELDRGFSTQPDYSYAYFMRACANAKLGRIAEALADEERGLELFGDPADDSVFLAAERGTAHAIADMLRALVAARRTGPSDAPCDRLWERDIRRRDRSPLLGPAPIAPADPQE